MANTHLNAKFTFNPSRSQVLLVAMVVFSIIALLCSASLLGEGKQAGWAFLGIAAITIIAVLAAWLRSQSDTDLDKAHATHLTMADGTQLTTDSRLVRTPQGIEGLLTLITSAISRQPLPDPEGLVDSNNCLIPASQDSAREIVNNINSENKAIRDSFIKALRIEDTDSPLIEIPASTEKIPSTEVPADLNIPSSLT